MESIVEIWFLLKSLNKKVNNRYLSSSYIQITWIFEENSKTIFKNIQLNNIVSNIIEIDLLDAGEFDLRQATAFYFQLTSVVVDFTANTFFRAIAVICFDILRKYKIHTGTKQQ